MIEIRKMLWWLSGNGEEKKKEVILSVFTRNMSKSGLFIVKNEREYSFRMKRKYSSPKNSLKWTRAQRAEDQKEENEEREFFDFWKEWVAPEIRKKKVCAAFGGIGALDDHVCWLEHVEELVTIWSFRKFDLRWQLPHQLCDLFGLFFPLHSGT